MAVSPFKVKLFVDCKKIAEKPINTLGSISTAGFIMLGKVTRTRGPRSGSVPVSPGRCCWSWLGWAHGQHCHVTSPSLDTPQHCCDAQLVLIPLIPEVLVTFPSTGRVFLSFSPPALVWGP